MSPLTRGQEGDLDRTRSLVEWAHSLAYKDLPVEVVDRTKMFFVDWIGCAIAGRDHVSVRSMVQYSKVMGPETGACEIVGYPEQLTSAAFASLVNAASSHVVEQDDLHNSSMMHPATVVFPAALAMAQHTNATGKEFLTACVVGYEFACRTGEFLGKSHYKRFHTTATAGILGAAAAAAKLLRLEVDAFSSAIGTAGTQAAGLWQFLLDATHSKQVHTAHACAGGIFSAMVASTGLLGPRGILEGPRGMGATLGCDDPQPQYLDDDLGRKWSVLESSFKWHASCRHTHPSVDALLALMKENNIGADELESITAHTYQAAIDVLSLSSAGETVHQSKFSMGFVLAISAKNGSAKITDFTEAALLDPELRNLQRRVTMVLDPTIEAAFPSKWLGRVEILTKQGAVLSKTMEAIKGDPSWTLTKDELEAKVLALARYGKVKDLASVQETYARVWNLESETSLAGFAFF